MAVTFRVTRWDDQPWDTGGGPAIAVGDTFSVSIIDQLNYVATLAPSVSAYTNSLIADTWDDATFWWDGTLPSTIVLNQIFTIQTVDINNRTVWLNG